MKPRIYEGHPLKRHLGRATIAEWVSKQNSHPFKLKQKKDNHVDFCMASCISHMHSTLIKAIGFVTGVIELLCCKTSAAINDVKV